jgi:hypothetical protein
MLLLLRFLVLFVLIAGCVNVGEHRLNVTLQTLVFGAFHGRTFEEGAIFLKSEMAPVFPSHGKEGRGRLESLNVGGTR